MKAAICFAESSFKNISGKIYVKDFVREIQLLGVEWSDEDLEHICKIADKSGQVGMKV